MDMIKVKYECDSTERKRYQSDSLPSLEDYPGYYDFSIDLNQSPHGKSSSFYSELLKQVFIDMNKILLVHFHLNEDLLGFFIRALPVYASPDFSGIPVTRCTVHSVESDPKGNAHSNGLCNCANYDNVGHVLRTQSSDAQYYYDDLSGRHSVLVPLRKFQAGSQSFPVGYYFACKTSCPRGMQRRPINIVFTLETANGEVLGRRVLGVRICSCPKRDKERLERDYTRGKKRSYERPTKKFKSSASCSYSNDEDKTCQLKGSCVMLILSFELVKYSCKITLGFNKFGWGLPPQPPDYLGYDNILYKKKVIESYETITHIHVCPLLLWKKDVLMLKDNTYNTLAKISEEVNDLNKVLSLFNEKFDSLYQVVDLL